MNQQPYDIVKVWASIDEILEWEWWIKEQKKPKKIKKKRSKDATN